MSAQAAMDNSGNAAANSPANDDDKLSPSVLQQPGTEGGPRFVMSKAEWLTIQVYVNNALNLPITTEAFGKNLGPGAPSDLSEFSDLVGCYKDLHDHCSTWQSKTYPMTVSLASDVYNYGINTVPTYYDGLLDPINVLMSKTASDADKATAKDTFNAILGAIKDEVSGYAQKAKDAKAAVQAFAEQTAADKRALMGADGKGGIAGEYQAKYGTRSEEVKLYQQQIEAARLELSGYEAEYKHDVIVASTSPTYAWIFPAGTIAAAVVAGVYGKRATDALDNISATKDRINTLDNKIKADAALISALDLANTSILNIADALVAALPVIEKVQGFWSSMSDDIDNITDTVQKNMGNAIPIIAKLGVSKAIKQWDEVGRAADQYRLNAYISTDGGNVQSLEEFKKKREEMKKAS